MPLLRRNAPRREEQPASLSDPGRSSFDDPVARFDVPNGFKKETPWNVAAYWMEQLKDAGRWPDDWPTDTQGVRMGLRPAKALLEEHDYVNVLRAIRWWCGPKGLKRGRAFRLAWLRKNMDLFHQRVYERRNQ